MVKVKFLKNVAWADLPRVGYRAGEEAEVPEEQVELLLYMGWAEKVTRSQAP